MHENEIDDDPETTQKLRELSARLHGAFRKFVGAAPLGRELPSPPRTTAPEPTSHADLDRAIHEVKNHPAYFNDRHPEHAAVKARAARLYEQRYQNEED
jgi:hypothetical protein